VTGNLHAPFLGGSGLAMGQTYPAKSYGLRYLHNFPF
jgi:hypothetical protein